MNYLFYEFAVILAIKKIISVISSTVAEILDMLSLTVEIKNEY